MELKPNTTNKVRQILSLQSPNVDCRIQIKTMSSKSQLKVLVHVCDFVSSAFRPSQNATDPDTMLLQSLNFLNKAKYINPHAPQHLSCGCSPSEHVWNVVDYCRPFSLCNWPLIVSCSRAWMFFIKFVAFNLAAFLLQCCLSDVGCNLSKVFQIARAERFFERAISAGMTCDTVTSFVLV